MITCDRNNPVPSTLVFGKCVRHNALKGTNPWQEPTKQKLGMRKVMTLVKCVGFWELEGWQVKKTEAQNVALPGPLGYMDTMWKVWAMCLTRGCSQFSSVQSLSHVRLFETPWTAACQASLSITNSWSLLKPTSIESVMPSNYLILCRPLLLLPPIPLSIRVFSMSQLFA